jgi:uncharacterized protein
MQGVLTRLKRTYWDPVDGRVVVLFVLTTAVLLAWDFHGRAAHFRPLARQFAGWPLAGVYERVYFSATAFVLFFLVPVAVVKWGFREPLADYGLTVGDWRKGLKFAAFFLGVMIPVIWIASRTQVFQHKYPLTDAAGDSLNHFLLYEGAFLVYFVGWEFLFRGFLLVGLSRRFGAYSILIQLVPFAIMHVRKPEAEAFGAIVAAVALGVLGLETRSCWYGVALHWIVAVMMDVAALQAKGLLF